MRTVKKLFPAFALILVATSIGFAQIVITPKKTVYNRKGSQFTKEKRTFVVTYPRVSGAISAASKKKLENTISYWRVFETTLQENRTEGWLSEFSYQVNYNKNGVLDIALTQEGSGAYPDQSTVELIIDAKTGEQIKFGDVFKTESLDKFAKMVDKKLSGEKAKLIRLIDKGEYSENGKEAADSLREQIGALSFTAETFNEFSVGDKGLTIFYNAGFPHVIQAAQPDGRYFFAWNGSQVVYQTRRLACEVCSLIYSIAYE